MNNLQTLTLSRHIGLFAVLVCCVSVPEISQAQNHPTFSHTKCDFERPHDPHISKWSKDNLNQIQIKVATRGECTTNLDPIDITPNMVLERKTLSGWKVVSVGTPITKTVTSSKPATWNTGEMFAVSECVEGVYRGREDTYGSQEGSIVLYWGLGVVSNEVKIDCKLKHKAFIIDNSQSMNRENWDIHSAFVKYLEEKPEDEYIKWDLIRFKDQIDQTKFTTTDDGAMRSHMLSHVSSGGGECSENVIGGIQRGLDQIGNDPIENKELTVFTDADAFAGDIDGVIAVANANDVNVNVVLSGHCSENTLFSSAARADFSDGGGLEHIARETGGKFVFVDVISGDDYTEVLTGFFQETIKNPNAEQSATTQPNDEQVSSASSGSGAGFWLFITLVLPAGLRSRLVLGSEVQRYENVR